MFLETLSRLLTITSTEMSTYSSLSKSNKLGHSGQKSPRKNRIIDLDHIQVVKLRSPAKRSMADLNRQAFEKAINIKLKHEFNQLGVDEDDIIIDEEESLADKIILQSKKDGLTPLTLELDEEDELEEEETNISLDSVSSLTNSPNKKRTVIEQLQSASSSPSKSPRKSPKKRASSVFNTLEDIKPKGFKSSLMEVPTLDKNDDILLQPDPQAKKKSLYFDGYEAYFEQNKLKSKPSTNSMTMAPPVSYDEFHKYNKLLDFICSNQIENLNTHYNIQFTQWLFEIQEGFNLAFYGIGSKRKILFQFVQTFLLPSVLSPSVSKSKCLVINGYNPELHIRTLLKTIWKTCFNKATPTARDILDLSYVTQREFKKSRNSSKKLILMINNIDGESLRHDKDQFILSELAKLEQITLICSFDNLNTPILWDTSVMSGFNFMFHNISTFKSYSTEISFKDPLSIGKSNEFVGSKGAKYVLSSLTANAKNLYRNLIIQQLEKIDVYISGDTQLLDNRGSIKGSVKTCLSFREFYELCVSEFITSNEISFRTILGEFVEHKMCHLTRNASGTEVLFIPFNVDEMEKVLEEELLDS